VGNRQPQHRHGQTHASEKLTLPTHPINNLSYYTHANPYN